MDIVIVATTLAPWVQGGRSDPAAESAAALAKALREQGHGVTLLLPRSSELEHGGLLMGRRLTPISVGEGPEAREVIVFDARLPSGANLVLLDFPGRVEFSSETPERGEALLAFAEAAVAVLRHAALQTAPGAVVQTFDALGCLAALLERPEDPPVVVTLTQAPRRVPVRAGAAGSSAGRSLERKSLARLDRAPDGVTVDLFEVGLRAAASVVAPSPSYAAALVVVSGPASELHSVFAELAEKVTTIEPGCDYALWNPAIDASLPARFSAEDSESKGICKTGLLRALELELRPERPLVAVLGATGREEGLDLVLAALPRLMKLDLSMVIAGRPDEEHRGALKEAVAEHAGRLAFVEAPDLSTEHRVLAAADALLLPARSAAYPSWPARAARYGAVPVAHEVETYRDVIVDCDAALETGTGFLFAEATSRDVAGAVARLVAAYGTAPWLGLRRRLMRRDVSWDRAARRYAQQYRQLAAALAGAPASVSA